MTKAFVDHADNLHALENHYLNLLPTPGTVLFRDNARGVQRSCWYVLGVCAFGVSTLRCVNIKYGDKHCWNLKPDGVMCHELLHIKGIAGWKVMPIKVLPPVASGSKPFLLLHADISTKHTLLQTAATEAFPRLTGLYLDKLIAWLGVKLGDARPSLIHEKVSALVKHVFPNMEKKEVDAIVQQRAGQKSKNHCANVLDDSSDVVVTSLEKSEAMDLLHEVELAGKAKARREQLRDDLAKTDKKRGKARALPDVEAFAAADFKPFLPDVPGTAISIEHAWHHRIRGYYPKQSAPFSCSRAFQEGGRMREPALEVLRWIWNEHREQTGQSCPWRLE